MSTVLNRRRSVLKQNGCSLKNLLGRSVYVQDLEQCVLFYFYSSFLL